MKKSGRKDNIHETPDVSHIQNPDVSHERSDVNLKSIVLFAAGLVVLAVFVSILMGIMYRTLDAREAQEEGKPAPMALSKEEQMPPEPRLQAAPGFGVDVDQKSRAALEEKGYRVDQNGRVDLSLKEPQAEMRVLSEQWKNELEEGGPDRKTGQPRLPIAQAMQQLVQQGVPTRQPEPGQQPANANQQPVPQASEHGMDMPSFWSSGQQTEKRDQ